MKGLIMSVEIYAHGGPAGLFGRSSTGARGCRFSARLKTTLVRFVFGGEVGSPWNVAERLFVVRRSGVLEKRREIRKGVARVLSLVQVYRLAGNHPGLNQCLGFSRDQSEVGAWSPRNLSEDADP